MVVLLTKSNPVRGYIRSGGVAVTPYLRTVAIFAASAHRGQTRKDARKTPYISHPLRVASILRHVGGVEDEAVLAAAILHDTIEDTHVTHADLVENFGAHVAGMVDECSDDKSLPKIERKRLQVEHAPHKSPGAALVKVADKMANLRDIIDSAPVGWSKERQAEYFEWAKAVVDRLPLSNSALVQGFNELYREGLQKL